MAENSLGGRLEPLTVNASLAKKAAEDKPSIKNGTKPIEEELRRMVYAGYLIARGKK